MVRHALSEWNVQGRWQGQADPPLSEEGVMQARAAAEVAGDFDLVVTSDLERARATGALLAPGVRLVTEADLREFDVGEWSGRTWAEIQATWPDELARFQAGGLGSAPGGETRPDFERRVQRAAGRVRRLVEEAGADRTLVVTHGGVLRALARMQNGVDHHVGHLGGYEAEDKGEGLAILRPVDLLAAVATGRESIDRMAL